MNRYAKRKKAKKECRAGVPVSVSRPLDAVRAETIIAVFDWIQNHTDIKDASGNILPDAYVDIRDVKLMDYLREHGI